MRATIFSTLSLHAKMHKKLDGSQSAYQDMLFRIERDELLAAENPIIYNELEALKRELEEIEFVNKD